MGHVKHLVGTIDVTEKNFLCFSLAFNYNYVCIYGVSKHMTSNTDRSGVSKLLQENSQVKTFYTFYFPDMERLRVITESQKLS